jgi:hypothetical protein
MQITDKEDIFLTGVLDILQMFALKVSSFLHSFLQMQQD